VVRVVGVGGGIVVSQMGRYLGCMGGAVVRGVGEGGDGLVKRSGFWGALILHWE
jgi:hypothetical protein